MAIKPLELDDGSVIYVEVDEQQAADLLASSVRSGMPPDLPPGAEPTGLLDQYIIGGKLLQETIGKAAQSAKNSLKEVQPDEWSVEINVGFESTDKGIISYLGKGNGGLKVTATWKKSTQSADKAADT